MRRGVHLLSSAKMQSHAAAHALRRTAARTAL
jgi:hypothetical protein